jgi:hypothetical protein
MGVSSIRIGYLSVHAPGANSESRNNFHGAHIRNQITSRLEEPGMECTARGRIRRRQQLECLEQLESKSGD